MPTKTSDARAPANAMTQGSRDSQGPAPRPRVSTGTKCCIAAVIRVITPTASTRCAQKAGDRAAALGRATPAMNSARVAARKNRSISV